MKFFWNKKGLKQIFISDNSLYNSKLKKIKLQKLTKIDIIIENINLKYRGEVIWIISSIMLEKTLKMK